MTDCTRCGRLTLGEAYLTCETCLDLLAQSLGDVRWLDAELEVTITRQRGIPTEGASASAETGLPWHDKASKAKRALRNTLSTWVRLCDKEGVRNSDPRTGLPADTLPAMASWLTWRIDGLALHEAGDQAVSEIARDVEACRRLIDRRPDHWYAGPCNECGADLYAVAKTGMVTCECGLTYDVGARRDWLLAEAEDRLADANTIARAVSWLGAQPLSPSRVRKWAERGRIVAKGHDGRSPLYRVGDAIDLLADDTARSGGEGVGVVSH